MNAEPVSIADKINRNKFLEERGPDKQDVLHNSHPI